MPPKNPVPKIKSMLAKGVAAKKASEFEGLLLQLKAMIVGSEEEKPSPEVVKQTLTSMHEEDILFDLVFNLSKISFEAKKHVVLIFKKSIAIEINDTMPTVDYIEHNKPEILTLLCEGYKNKEDALNYGQMLRECLKQEKLLRTVLYSDELFKEFFVYAQDPQFDVASDAFSTLKALLTNSKIICSKFLDEKYDSVFEEYLKLLKSDNYVTKRQSLKLLGELLLDRANFTVMTKYIANADNLQLMMKLLQDSSRNIQFEAFHVFKVFVANPNKEEAILKILVRNKDKLATFLEKFHEDRGEDEQFADEKKYLIKQISELSM